GREIDGRPAMDQRRLRPARQLISRQRKVPARERLRVWWALLDSNQRPRDYESEVARKPQQTTIEGNIVFIGEMITGLLCRFPDCCGKCAASVPKVCQEKAGVAPHDARKRALLRSLRG